MKIRQANILDIKSIKSLADTLAVNSSDSKKITGFYNYPLNETQYFNRITSPFFFVAESQKGLEGFCMAYNSKFLKALVKKESGLKEDTLLKYLSELHLPLVYIDQLAVREPETIVGSLTAYNLRNKIIGETKRLGISNILGVVAHKPWKNILAVKFCEKSGFEFQQEVNSKGILLGIYKLNI